MMFIVVWCIFVDNMTPPQTVCKVVGWEETYYKALETGVAFCRADDDDAYEMSDSERECHKQLWIQSIDAD